MTELQQNHAVVTCKKCGGRAPVHNPERLPDRFSVACPHCGQWAIYRTKDIKPAETN